MARTLPIASLNGDFQPLESVRISPLDRGFLFGDGVYEVIPVYDGLPFRMDPHVARLANSLAAIRVPNPLTPAEWRQLVSSLIEANGAGTMSVYLQVSRGADVRRDHGFPGAATATVFAMCSSMDPMRPEIRRDGAAAMVTDDTRWQRCDIKATSLLPNVLTRQLAEESGCIEAIMVRDGLVTEGAASTVFIVSEGVVVTPPNGPGILPGTTRDLVLELADSADLPTRIAPVTEAQLRSADEIWLTSATREVVPVSRLDGAAVGAGRPGPVWQRMVELYQGYKARLAESAA